MINCKLTFEYLAHNLVKTKYFSITSVNIGEENLNSNDFLVESGWVTGINMMLKMEITLQTDESICQTIQKVFHILK